MTRMQPERFVAGLTPLPTAARVSRQRGALRWRIISTLISGALLAALMFWLYRDWPEVSKWVIGSLWVASSAVWLIVSLVGLSRAKRDLAMIQEGVAFYLDPVGIEFVYPRQARVPWAQVTAFKLVGHNLGAGPALSVESEGEEIARVPVSFLDATPAVIDSMAQACSLGRVRLDISTLDHVF